MDFNLLFIYIILQLVFVSHVNAIGDCGISMRAALVPYAANDSDCSAICMMKQEFVKLELMGNSNGTCQMWCNSKGEDPSVMNRTMGGICLNKIGDLLIASFGKNRVNFVHYYSNTIINKG